jgi:hypothetical protein
MPRSSLFQFNDIRRGALCHYIEKELDLPAVLVNGSNCAGAQSVVVGQKHHDFAGILAQRLDAAQQMRALLLRSGASEPDDLVLEDVAVLGRFSCLDDLEQGVVLHARDEEHPGLGPFGKQSVIVVSPVIDDDRVRGKAHLMGRLDVMHLALGDDAKTGQISVVIEHQMQLDRALGAAKLRPVIHRQTQVDHSRVDAHELVLEAELALALHLGSDLLEQFVENLLRKLPRTVVVGIAQR